MSAVPSQPGSILRSLAAAKAAAARASRDDPALFCRYVLRDERTGGHIKLAPMQEAWHQLVTKNRYTLIWSSVESGKTQQLAVGRVLWELGRNPGLRACILSNTHRQAAKIIGAISGYVKNSRELREVFPGLRPGDPWTSSAVTIERPMISKDPSVQATGVHGNILGSRVDLLVIDDLLDFENTLTPAARDGLWNWVNATVMGRLTQDAKVVVVGNAHHPEDAMHRWARNPAWQAFRYPVLDEQGRPRWPERWPAERIERARQEMVPVEFARQLLCVARDDASSRFKGEWIRRCLARGEGKKLAWGLRVVPGGCKVYTGVDLAVQKHSSADLTVFFTILVHPNGDREVIGLESGRFTGPEIIERIVDVHYRYQSVVIVENVSSQDFILQFARSSSAVPVRPFTTGRNKAHPEFGIESLAAEMENGKWIIPNEGGRMDPEVDAWVQEMYSYDPASHTGDRLMASWFAREGVRMGNIVAEVGRVNLMAR